MSRPKFVEHLISILQLPFVVIVVIPFLILKLGGEDEMFFLREISNEAGAVLGAIFLVLGLILLFKSIVLLHKIGMGTLAPWNPTKKMVIQGVYRHVRNPMLIGVNLIVLAECFVFMSGNLMIWLGLFLVLNHLYFIFFEEPALENKFGKEYLEYKKNVPRWLPRIKPWTPESVK